MRQRNSRKSGTFDRRAIASLLTVAAPELLDAARPWYAQRAREAERRQLVQRRAGECIARGRAPAAARTVVKVSACRCEFHALLAPTACAATHTGAERSARAPCGIARAFRATLQRAMLRRGTACAQDLTWPCVLLVQHTVNPRQWAVVALIAPCAALSTVAARASACACRQKSSESRGSPEGHQTQLFSNPEHRTRNRQNNIED